MNTDTGHGTVKSYITGFVLSLILTLAAYFAVTEHWAAGWTLLFILAGLGTAQLIVQLIFFLHLNRESKPRWNLMVFGLMLTVLLVVVVGSLWIMDNLDYHSHSMSPAETTRHIQEDEGIKR